MTVSSLTQVVYTAFAGVVADTPIAFGGNLDDTAEVEVWYNGDQLAVISTHYTVTLASDFLTAQVTPNATLVALLDGTSDLVIRRKPTYLQPINVAAIQGLPEQRIMRYMDRTTQQLLFLQDQLDRVMKQQAGIQTHALTLSMPTALSSALGKWLRFSSTTEGLIELVDQVGWQQLSADPSTDGSVGVDTDLGVVITGTNVGQVYKKVSGTWTDQGWSIRGPEGPQGDSGDGSGDLISTQNLADLDNAATARGNLGLGNVENTADADKPISTAAAAKNTTQDAAIALNTAKVSFDSASSTKLAGIATEAQDNRGKHAFYVDAMGMRPQVTSGAEYGFAELPTNDIVVDFYRFDDTTREYVQFKFMAPKSWGAGTISARVAWGPDTATTGNVIWGIEAVCIGNDDPLDAAWGTAVEVTDACPSAADDQAITDETGDITVADAAAEEMMCVRIYRDAADASDTLAGDAFLYGIELFLTTDQATDA